MVALVVIFYSLYNTSQCYILISLQILVVFYLVFICVVVPLINL